MVDGIGLSVGATSLTAVVVGRTAVTRSPVLTVYPHRPPEVGVPSENPNLTERGLILTDFVDRVGDPVGMLASDGSSHRGEDLVADALGALLRAVMQGRPVEDPISITHPAHWRSNQVEALRHALAAVPEFATPPTVVPDATAALIALQDKPGLPSRGVIAVCDFGGSGSSITLADAGNGYQPIAPTVRYPDLSGDLIDQAVLTHVVDDLSAAGAIDLTGTSAIGSLGRLRGECRRAKERLSTDSVTALTAELPGHRSEVRLNRGELEDVMGAPLREFTAELTDAVNRAGGVVAVATIGGGARIPALTTALSQQLHVPVITGAQPELTAAIGGGLAAVRGVAPDGATALASAVAPMTATAMAVAAPEPPPASNALAWSDTDDVPEVEPVGYDAEVDSEFAAEFDEPARPEMEFHEPEQADAAVVPWYRKPALIVGAGAAVVLAAVASVAMVMANHEDAPNPSPASNSRSVTVTTSSPAPAVEAPPIEQAPPEQAPAVEQAPVEQAPEQTETVTQEAPPPQTVTQTVEPPPTTEAPPPTSEAPTTTEAPPTTQEPTTTQPQWSPTAPYPTIPGLPWVPAPGGGHQR